MSDNWFDQVGDDAYEKQVGYVASLQGDGAGGELTKKVKAWLTEVNLTVPRRARRSDGFHASSMGNVCNRYETFRRVLPRASDARQFSPDLLLRFQVGHAVHHWWQNKLLGKMRILKGTWECSRCTRVVKNVFMPSDPCEKCRWQVDPVKHFPQPRGRQSVDCATGCVWPGTEEDRFAIPTRDCVHCERGGEWLFRETSITIPDPKGGDDHIVGAFDGILVPEPNHEQIGEFKTKDTMAWKWLKEPEYKHAVQVNVYMMQPGMPQEAIVCYIDKNSGMMKEFVLVPDPAIVKKIKADAALVRVCVEEKELPNGVCASRTDKRAKECSYREECFLGLNKLEDILERINAGAAV